MRSISDLVQGFFSVHPDDLLQSLLNHCKRQNFSIRPLLTDYLKIL